MPLADPRGGAEMLLMQWLRANRQGPGLDASLAFLEEGPMTTQAAALGYPVCVLPAGRLRQPHHYLGTVRRLYAWLRKERFAGVVSWMPKAHLYTALAARLAGVPTAWWQHTIPDGQRMDRLVTRLPARGILCCSKAAEEAQRRLSPRRCTRVVPPSVDLGRWAREAPASAAEARRGLGLPLDGPLIGMVGRLQRWKGMHVLVEALPQLLRSHPDLRCVIVGGDHALEPDYPAELRASITALGLTDRVLLTGLQCNVPEWMQAMDVVVHASDAEPFGMVIIEAMALGKPVVAGDAGGPTEIVTHGVDGLLTSYGDATALAEAVGRYLDDPLFARRIGDAARRRAQDFSACQFAENFSHTLNEIFTHG